jgi:hypothetical protein
VVLSLIYGERRGNAADFSRDIVADLGPAPKTTGSEGEVMVDVSRSHTSSPGKMAIAGMLHAPLSRIECRPMIIFDCHLVSNSSDTVHVSFLQVAMNSRDNQGPDRDVRERIVKLMQSIGKGPKKQIPAEELPKLESAASRLDQMLKAAANADQQALKSAAARLDQLLSDIRAGKDVTSNLKRRENSGT